MLPFEQLQILRDLIESSSSDTLRDWIEVLNDEDFEITKKGKTLFLKKSIAFINDIDKDLRRHPLVLRLEKMLGHPLFWQRSKPSDLEDGEDGFYITEIPFKKLSFAGGVDNRVHYNLILHHQ